MFICFSFRLLTLLLATSIVFTYQKYSNGHSWTHYAQSCLVNNLSCKASLQTCYLVYSLLDIYNMLVARSNPLYVWIFQAFYEWSIAYNIRILYYIPHWVIINYLWPAKPCVYPKSLAWKLLLELFCKSYDFSSIAAKKRITSSKSYASTPVFMTIFE